ncbi:MAG: CIA30 family protein [Myxococcota bacterium]
MTSILIFLGALAMAADPVDILTPDRAWTTVHDTVMGGVSQGRVTPLDDAGAVRFTGTVSLENNGGFASSRTVPAPLSLEGIDAFRIEVQGEKGATWSFTVRRDDLRIRGGSWRVQFQTTGERQVVEFPLADFEAVSMGRRLPDAPPLTDAPQHIDSVGFLIGNKQAGAYELKVHRIAGVSRR